MGSVVSDEIKQSAYRWCYKYEMLFQVIAVEDDLREYLKEFSVYEAPKEHLGIFPLLDECMHQAYEAGVVVTNYREIIEENSLSERDLQRPSEEWTDTLTAEQILACIAWHFRRDHFSEGSWICDSIANGHMLTLVRGFIKAFEAESI